MRTTWEHNIVSLPIDTANQLDALDSMGAAGWELVCVVHRDYEQDTVIKRDCSPCPFGYFKRPKLSK